MNENAKMMVGRIGLLSWKPAHVIIILDPLWKQLAFDALDNNDVIIVEETPCLP